LGVIAFIEPNDSIWSLCENRPRNIRVQVKNLGILPINFAQTPSVFKTFLTRPVGRDSFTITLSSGILAVDSVQNVQIGAFTPSNYGKYALRAFATTNSDNTRLNDTINTELTFVAPRSLPFYENFDGSQILTGWNVPANLGFSSRGREGNSLTAFMRSSSAPVQKLVLPKVGKITDTATALSFDYRIMNDFGNQTTPNSPNWGKIDIAISSDCGRTFTTLKTIDSTNHLVSGQHQAIRIPMRQLLGSDVVIQIAITRTIATDFYVDFDNFYIGSPCRQITERDSILRTVTPTCTITGAETVLNVQRSAAFYQGNRKEWQYSSDSMRTWKNYPLNLTYISPTQLNTNVKSYPIFYRLKTTCATDNSSTASNTIEIKPNAAVTIARPPYRESFENWQTSTCIPTFVSKDIPNANWTNSIYYGSNSWRRHDEGTTGGWNASFRGQYSPPSTAGLYSARYHSSDQLINPGALDLNIDLNSPQDKQLSFNYINQDGADGLKILLSSDGGVTFQPLDTPLSIARTWRRLTYILPANGSARSVLRLEGNAFISGVWQPIGDNSDIGIDSLSIEAVNAQPACATLIYPQNNEINVQEDVLIRWQSASFATGYRVKIGTTSGGTEVLPLTDVGGARQFKIPTFLDYQKRYFVQIEPYNGFGKAQGCPNIAFTTMKNPNFGGGADGRDSLQPLSKGYTFANSTTFAQTALQGRATYAWIDPRNHNLITNLINTNGTVNGYHSSSLLFDFPFYSRGEGSQFITIGSNGILGFDSDVSGYYPTKPSHRITTPTPSSRLAIRNFIEVRIANYLSKAMLLSTS
jgi:hypothetical protein